MVPSGWWGEPRREEWRHVGRCRKGREGGNEVSRGCGGRSDRGIKDYPRIKWK